MIKRSFNKGWQVKKRMENMLDWLLPDSGQSESITLPHDAMVNEARDPKCASGTQTGFYPGQSLTYTNTFDAPQDWLGKRVLMAFEGVQNKAMVYVNDAFAAGHLNGYSQFNVDLTPHLIVGQTNTVKVNAISQDLSSRWYPGSGLYRHVNLLVGDLVHIEPDGVRITTEALEDDYAVVRIDADLCSLSLSRQAVKWVCELFDRNGKLVTSSENIVTLPASGCSSSRMRLTISDPNRWSPEHPDLYRCITKIILDDQIVDQTEETFGIRILQLDARQGLRINGEVVKLRGACIHHDNGIIGASTFYKAEEYRCKKLKEAGFNSIRSAHHPMSRQMLAACDKFGMLVMDELGDMWNESKNPHDYAQVFSDNWQAEVEKMVAKDYNHPCVILYSTGNEIPDTSNTGGRIINRQIANGFKSLDGTRYVTSGLNALLALGRDYMPLVQEARRTISANSLNSDQAPAEDPEEKASGGTDDFNDLMADVPDEVNQYFTTHPLLTNRLEELSCELDIAGFNYMTYRHELERQLHPDRIVVGSETYSPEIADLWRIVQQNPSIIGDFVWTGYDYLGEAGIGIYYYDGQRSFQGSYPDRVAYCGDINLIGYRRPLSYLREIVYGLRKTPYIAVERVDRHGQKPSKNRWMYEKDVIASWTFPGYEGKPATVDVFSPSQEVELVLNGISVGRQAAGEANEFVARFQLAYEPGELQAVGYTNGVEAGCMTLMTAQPACELKINSDTLQLNADGQDLAFIMVELVDDHGNINMWDQKAVSIKVEGAGTLQGFGSADPQSERSYQDTTWETYDGQVMAVIRSMDKPGKIDITFSAQGCQTKTVTIVSE